MSQCLSGLVVIKSLTAVCEASQDGIPPQVVVVVFITAATVIYSLGCGLYTLPAVPTSTQTSILRGTERDVSLKADTHYPYIRPVYTGAFFDTHMYGCRKVLYVRDIYGPYLWEARIGH